MIPHTDKKTRSESRKPSEAEVVLWLKRHLIREGLQHRQVREILVDADPIYLRAPFSRELHPTGTLWIGSWRPDVICVLGDERAEKIIGIEVKSNSEHEKGIVQAAQYRDGVHESYLCVPWGNSKLPDWLREGATHNGVGLIRAGVDRLTIEVQAPRPRPDPTILLTTRRYLLGESSLRALGLNKPLHYAAALLAFTYYREPREALNTIWGLKGSAVTHAIRGAKTLGLMSDDEKVTLKGHAYSEILKTLGFDLANDRVLTSKRRLIDFNPGYGAVLRSVLLDHPAVQMIARVLIKHGGGPLTIIQLVELALIEDEGMARAVFGIPPEDPDVWQIRPSTRFNLKAALYDIGIIDSPLARGASSPPGTGGYDPMSDIWQVGSMCVDAY